VRLPSKVQSPEFKTPVLQHQKKVKRKSNIRNEKKDMIIDIKGLNHTKVI
jgi:hypothetical protein